jgi:hypothetical protein
MLRYGDETLKRVEELPVKFEESALRQLVFLNGSSQKIGCMMRSPGVLLTLRT